MARLDSDGDVLLAGPAVRAVATRSTVTLLVGPQGWQAAELLPGVADIIEWSCPWIVADPSPVDPADINRLVALLAGRAFDEALILTSAHQSPLPLALLLRLAGVGRIAAASEDYPGALLDVRHRLPEDGWHEVERALSAAAALGYELPLGDDSALQITPRPSAPPLPALFLEAGYLVVHPGASVPARTWDPARFAALVDQLAARGHPVVVTGGPGERALTRRVAGGAGLDLGGATDLRGLAAVLAGARAVVVGNTGPAHLAAAVGTPVVSLFAPTVPAERWAPWRTPLTLLGDQGISCAGCRSRSCPVPGQPCLDLPVPAVLEAVLAAAGAPRADSLLQEVNR